MPLSVCNVESGSMSVAQSALGNEGSSPRLGAYLATITTAGVRPILLSIAKECLGSAWCQAGCRQAYRGFATQCENSDSVIASSAFVGYMINDSSDNNRNSMLTEKLPSSILSAPPKVPSKSHSRIPIFWRTVNRPLRGLFYFTSYSSLQQLVSS